MLYAKTTCKEKKGVNKLKPDCTTKFDPIHDHSINSYYVSPPTCICTCVYYLSSLFLGWHMPLLLVNSCHTHQDLPHINFRYTHLYIVCVCMCVCVCVCVYMCVNHRHIAGFFHWEQIFTNFAILSLAEFFFRKHFVLC